MDPASGISSPFHNLAQGRDGVFDGAIQSITSAGGAAPVSNLPGGTPLGPTATSPSLSSSAALAPVTSPLAEVFGTAAPPASSHASSSGGTTLPTTVCTVCDEVSTTARVPDEGIYVCSSCSAQAKRMNRPPRMYPTLTFTCCPAATTDAGGGVVRCAGCQMWYHHQCVGITDPGVQQYVQLTTTQWYCPEPSCAEAMLMKHIKLIK